MNRRNLVKGLIVTLILFFLTSVIGYFIDFYFKVFVSLFLINFALVFFLKFIKFLKRKSVEKRDIFESRLLDLIIIYGVPILILGYILYLNWLPFGFERTYILDVGSKGDTTISKKVYLEKTPYLSDPVEEGNRTFRRLDGQGYLIVKPRAKIRYINANIEGNNVFIVPPKLNFNPEDYKWDLKIDFFENIPDFLEGNADHINECAYFDGQSLLEYPETQNEFEKEPFSIYVEWTPENDKEDSQQIIGHYNWELLQGKNKISFQIGRVNNENGRFYDISHKIKPDFFNKKHSAVIVYSPNKEEGYIELFIDDSFIKREYIGKDSIWEEYSNRSLSIGKSGHIATNYYIGCIHEIAFTNKTLDLLKKDYSFPVGNSDVLKLPLIGKGTIESIKLQFKK